MFGKDHIIKLQNFIDKDTIEATVECKFSGEEYILTVKLDDLYEWKDGKAIQDAMPYLESWEREILITGIGPNAWKKMFGG